MTKTKPIVRGNIVVWPVIPNLTAGVKLHDQHPRDPSTDNVAVLPVICIERKAEAKPGPAYNDIQDVVARTMRGQRYTARSDYAVKKLRKMFENPA